MVARRTSSYSEVDTTLVTTAETVVATLTGVSTGGAGQTVALTGRYNITTGGSTTALVTRIRRDSLTGTQVGETQTEQVSAAAGSSESHTIYREDVGAGEFGSRTYVLTVSQTAAAANGTANNASLIADVGP
jgi:hypothetical protein